MTGLAAAGEAEVVALLLLLPVLPLAASLAGAATAALTGARIT